MMFTSTPDPDSPPKSKKLKRVSAATMAVVFSATVIGVAPPAQAQSSHVDHFTQMAQDWNALLPPEIDLSHLLGSLNALQSGLQSFVPGSSEDHGPANSTQMSAVERGVFDDVNRFRAQHGLPALIPDTGYANGARQWSHHLASTNSHIHHPDGGDFFENLTYANSPGRAIVLWENSPGHRSGMLNNKLTHAGVGIAKKSNGQFVVTWRAHWKPSEPHNSVGAPGW